VPKELLRHYTIVATYCGDYLEENLITGKGMLYFQRANLSNLTHLYLGISLIFQIPTELEIRDVNTFQSHPSTALKN
jgi:hypothetical protein